MEWTAHATLGALLVEPVRLLERVGVDRDRRVDTLLIEGDSQEVGLDQSTGGNTPFLHRALHLEDGCLDDVEAFSPSLGRRAGRKRRSQQASDEQKGGTSLEYGHGLAPSRSPNVTSVCPEITDTYCRPSTMYVIGAITI